MVQLNFNLQNVSLSQSNSFEPQLRVGVNVTYNQFGGMKQPSFIEIVDAKGRLFVTKGNVSFEISKAELEHQTSMNISRTETIWFIVRLSPYLLYRIEELRSGDEFSFRFEGWSGLCVGHFDNNVTVVETINFQPSSNTWKYPKSEWILHLNATEFNKVELIEIPKIDFPQIPLTEDIVRFLGDANKAMFDGRYGDVLQECRKSIEALETGVKEWGKKNILDQEQASKNGKELENYLTQLIGDKEKTRRLNELRMTLRSYLSLDPHEAEYKSIVFIREDAKFVLYTTIGFINNILKYMTTTRTK